MKYGATLLNSKSIIDCDENEWEIHNQEIFNLIGRLQVIPNYDCALICKYQDPANRHKDQEIKSCKLRDILSITNLFDCKNGIDLLIDEDNYLCMMIFGQMYEYKDEYEITTVAVKIMPYNKDRDFVDIYGVLFEDVYEKVSDEQYDYDPKRAS